MLTDCGEYKTTNILLFVKIYTKYTLINNHFLSNKNKMVRSPSAIAVEFRDVPQRYYLSTLLSLLNILLAWYTEVKYQLRQTFFDELLGEIDNV